MELHEELLEEQDRKLVEVKDANKANRIMKSFLKRMRESVGWVEHSEEEYGMLDGKGKSYLGCPTIKKEICSVNLGDGCVQDCEEQDMATLLSIVAQMNERVKRIEKALMVK